MQGSYGVSIKSYRSDALFRRVRPCAVLFHCERAFELIEQHPPYTKPFVPEHNPHAESVVRDARQGEPLKESASRSRESSRTSNPVNEITLPFNHFGAARSYVKHDYLQKPTRFAPYLQLILFSKRRLLPDRSRRNCREKTFDRRVTLRVNFLKCRYETTAVLEISKIVRGQGSFEFNENTENNRLR